MTNPIRSNPNATVAGGTAGLGALAVYGLSLLGVDVPAEIALLAVGAVSTAVLFVGRVGIRGLVGRLWGGSDNASAHTDGGKMH